jgi:small subunit ribosomal protein S29e
MTQPAHEKLYYAKKIKQKFGKGARKCRVCNARQGLIRKYGIMMCRRCFRERAEEIGYVCLFVHA